MKPKKEANHSAKKPVVGAQMFTLRNFTKTIPQIQDTLKKVGEIGYTAVQLSALGPVDPKDLARVVSKSGLRVAATHVGWNRFQKELDQVIEEHRMLGCTHPAVGGLPGEYFSLAGLTKFVQELAPVADRLAKAGMDFSYHNHNHELAKFGDKTWLETLLSMTSAAQLKAEIDTYWIQAGGGDPAAWIRRCAGRIPLLHVKDMAIMPDRQVRMAEVGHGNLNWPEILKAAEESGVEYLLVEQDDCYGRDPFESLAMSYAFLKSMGYR